MIVLDFCSISFCYSFLHQTQYTANFQKLSFFENYSINRTVQLFIFVNLFTNERKRHKKALVGIDMSKKIFSSQRFFGSKKFSKKLHPPEGLRWGMKGTKNIFWQTVFSMHIKQKKCKLFVPSSQMRAEEHFSCSFEQEVVTFVSLVLSYVYQTKL